MRYRTCCTAIVAISYLWAACQAQGLERRPLMPRPMGTPVVSYDCLTFLELSGSPFLVGEQKVLVLGVPISADGKNTRLCNQMGKRLNDRPAVEYSVPLANHFAATRVWTTTDTQQFLEWLTNEIKADITDMVDKKLLSEISQDAIDRSKAETKTLTDQVTELKNTVVALQCQLDSMQKKLPTRSECKAVQKN